MFSAFRHALTSINIYRPSKPLIGIEIGASTVRLVVLERHHKGFLVKAFGVESFIRDGDEMNVVAVGSALSRLLMRCGVSSGQVAMVSPAPIMTRLLVLPIGLSDDDIDLYIRLEARQYISHPLNEVGFDFWVVGADETGLHVLLVVMREQMIDECVEIALGCGLELNVLDVQEYALARGLSHTVQTLMGHVCVLHIDDVKTHLYAVQIEPDGVFVGFNHHKEHLNATNTLDDIYGNKDKTKLSAKPSKVIGQENGDDENGDVGMDFDTFLQLHRKDSFIQDDVKLHQLPSDDHAKQMVTQTYEIRFDGGRVSDQAGCHDGQTPVCDLTDWTTQIDTPANPSCQDKAQKLLKILTAHESSVQMNTDMVILSGLADESLVQEFARISHKSVQLANPFVHMDVAYPLGDDSLSLLPSLVVACGVAMRADEGVV
ncbi:type IV pilus biogenesis protein PilM [Moraxella sp. ZY200743]|uniref:type IV pilus biogenesis protein PilM n=1 Tax=Moraxella sp. ZY200743 TaxID=2911970 RepID=UPI003D7D4C5B